MTRHPLIKPRKRYILFEVKGETPFSLEEIKTEVGKWLFNSLGEQGMARTVPIFLAERFNFPAQQFMIRVQPKYVVSIKTALVGSKKIKNSPVIVRSIITSGTLKALTAKTGGVSKRAV